MKIIILGAGQVGSSLAANLVSEANDITVVDLEPTLLQTLQDRFDLRTVAGRASHPEVLRRAGAEDADMIIAVTNSDETNMVACQVAYTLFHTPTKIARVRGVEYLNYPELFGQQALPIDVLISPEQLVTDYIARLIEHPGALQVLDFAAGRVQLVGVRAYYGGPLVGQQLRALRDHMPGLETRVAAIYRRDRAIIPEGDTVIEADDEVFFIAAKQDIRAVMGELRRLDRPVKRVMIAGGGNIGKRLAKALESRYQVKIIDHNTARTRAVSEELDRTIVLRGDAADEELLREESIEEADVFCALTNDDETNILASLIARQYKVPHIITLVNRDIYSDLVRQIGLNVTVSPKFTTFSAIMRHVRKGRILGTSPLGDGTLEVIEAEALQTSDILNTPLKELKLPGNTVVGAILREETVIIPDGKTRIRPHDRVIMVTNSSCMRAVEKLFEVHLEFF